MKKIIMIFVLSLLPFQALAESKETTFERISRTGVIRCGYYVFPPIMDRDANTGELSGITYDYMNLLAERAGLKVEWTTEVTWANWIPEIQQDRFDVACTPMWADLAMMKAVAFTDSMYFSGMYPLVAKDDPRFDGATLETLNSPEFTFVSQEGNSTKKIVNSVFPRAKIYALPPTASGGEYYQTLIAKKADVILTDPSGLSIYEESNGKNFKFIAMDTPVKIQSFKMAVRLEDADLLHFLNQSIEELFYSGDLDRILRKHEYDPGKSYLRPNKPYEAQK